ncbi:MAG: hypothetical protein AAFQ42_01025 [Pseudomonadota bacterium]
MSDSGAMIPAFIDEEVEAFDAALARVAEDGLPVLLARCRNLWCQAAEVEIFAAAYLLTNILLMERLNRPILKMVYVDEDREGQVLPTLNALRAAFDGGFSSLSNAELWQSLVLERVEMSERPVDQIRRTIAFVRGAGLMERSEYLRRADVFFGTADRSGGYCSPFTVYDSEVFRTVVTAKNRTLEVLTPEHFTAGEATYVKIENARKIVIVDVDFRSSGWLAAWMENVGNIVDAKIYAAGRRTEA